MWLKYSCFVFSFFVFSFNASSVEPTKIPAGFDPDTDVISENYEAGKYLIYDCEAKHWACIGESDYKDCQERRRDDKNVGSYYHSCAPLGIFPTKKSCFQRQSFLITHNHGYRFCIKDGWKDKAI
jgi:hypothetical protein